MMQNNHPNTAQRDYVRMALSRRYAERGEKSLLVSTGPDADISIKSETGDVKIHVEFVRPWLLDNGSAVVPIGCGRTKGKPAFATEASSWLFVAEVPSGIRVLDVAAKTLTSLVRSGSVISPYADLHGHFVGIPWAKLESVATESFWLCEIDCQALAELWCFGEA